MAISLDANLRLSQELAASAKQDGLLGRAVKADALGDKKAADKAQLKQAANDFESLFLDLVLKSMRQTVQKSGLIDGGNAEEIYRSMLDNEYSKIMAAQRHTGLADSIEKFLLEAYGDSPTEPPVSAKNAVQAYQAQGLPREEKRETMEPGLSPASFPRPKAI